jgi:hypothetical protein
MLYSVVHIQAAPIFGQHNLSQDYGVVIAAAADVEWTAIRSPCHATDLC